MSQDRDTTKTQNNVFMTVLTNAKYIPGVKALKKSLARVKSAHDLVILIPQENAAQLTDLLRKRDILAEDCYICTQPQINTDALQNVAQKDHYWNDTFFKLQAARCTQYEKIVLLDSDMMILRNIDHLFEYPSFSAVAAGRSAFPEWVKLNSGLMVLMPSVELSNKLMSCVEPAIQRRCSEGLAVGDQDVFHEAFPDWENHSELILPEAYNALWFCVDKVCRMLNCDYSGIYVVHFIGRNKPWSRETDAHIYNCKHLLSLLKHGSFWKISIYLKYIMLSK